MCDCRLCNMTEEEQQEAEELFVEWEYKCYCERTKNPLSMDEWIQSLPSPENK